MPRVLLGTIHAGAERPKSLAHLCARGTAQNPPADIESAGQMMCGDCTCSTCPLAGGSSAAALTLCYKRNCSGSIRCSTASGHGVVLACDKVGADARACCDSSMAHVCSACSVSARCQSCGVKIQMPVVRAHAAWGALDAGVVSDANALVDRL